jgi:hypothetical protein
MFSWRMMRLSAVDIEAALIVLLIAVLNGNRWAVEAGFIEPQSALSLCDNRQCCPDDPASIIVSLWMIANPKTA